MSKKLLLADDSVVIQKLVGLSFANEDVKIITVDNGDDAVTKAAESKPDLVLADVVMPGKSGYEVCEAVKQNPALAGTPVLLLTGTFEAFDEARAERAGADGHITKPFEAQALVDRVNTLLAEKARAGAAAPAAQPTNEFFDENIGDLAGSAPDLEMTPAPARAPAPPAAKPDRTDDFAFGGDDSDPLMASSPSDLGIGASDDGGLADLLDASNGDHTVAFMPEATPAAPPAAPPRPTPAAPQPPAAPVAAAAPPPIPKAPAVAPPPIPTVPAAPLIEEDLLSPDASDDLLAGTSVGSDPGATVLADDALLSPAPMKPMAAAPMDDPLADMAGPETSAVPALDVDDLSFGSQPTEPPSFGKGSPDETVLAGDLFGDDTSRGLPTASGRSAAPSLPPSNGLDLDFAESAPAASMPEAVVPENANDFDVSSSDLQIDPMNETPRVTPAPPRPEPLEAFAPAAAKPVFEAAPPVPAVPEPARLEPEMDEPLEAEPLDAEPIVNAPVAADPMEVMPISTADAMPEPDSGLALESESATSAAGPMPDLSPMMRDRIHDTLEKVAWEAFSDLSESIVKQVLKRVEEIAWEVIPEMAESLVREEIRRMKGDTE